MFAEDSAPLSSGVMSGGVGTLDTVCSPVDKQEPRSNGEISGGIGISCSHGVMLADGTDVDNGSHDDMEEKTSSWSYDGRKSEVPATSDVGEL